MVRSGDEANECTAIPLKHVIYRQRNELSLATGCSHSTINHCKKRVTLVASICNCFLVLPDSGISASSLSAFPRKYLSKLHTT